jgi:transcriptional regulator GlxA family with amidase domain
VRRSEAFLQQHFGDADALTAAVAAAGLPERTLKRHFLAATGLSLIDDLQNLRIEHGKQLLESTHLPVEEVSAASGCADASLLPAEEPPDGLGGTHPSR